jgi:hypothetical protein
MNTDQQLERINRFIGWLDRFGETSHDHQSYFASDWARKAKALYYTKPLLGMAAVSPMILSEAFAPSLRPLFWKRLRFPIADAHYAMGFAYLAETLQNASYLKRAVHFLDVLQETRCPGFQNHAWGYPFNWETRRGTLWEGTPMITTLPYVYEAFRSVWRLDRDDKWKNIMYSIARHGAEDYRDQETGDNAASCAYTPNPNDPFGVINASAYRSFLLTAAAADFGERRFQELADRNLNFVLQTQNADGSWYYATDGERDFVDHFHTCFVLKALGKIQQIREDDRCADAIRNGVRYYLQHLFDEEGMPKPFSRRPRLTVYKRELYDYAECINLATLLRGHSPELDATGARVLEMKNWQKADGSFRTRQLLIGWDNVPMHRWAQAQLFRALCLTLHQDMGMPSTLAVEPASTTMKAV